MTTILIPDVKPNPGKTYVFIIAIGYYPHLIDPSPKLQSKLSEFDLTTLEGYLSCPPISAIQFAEWMESKYQNLKAPLASIDMFISSGEQKGTTISPKTENYISLKTGNSHPVDRATWSNISQAFDQWLNQLKMDDVAIVYFCGHGLGRLGRTREQTLPLENFGKKPNMLFTDDAIDIENTFIGMTTACKAKTQCYLIDSCRQETEGLSKISGNLGLPLARGGRITSSVGNQWIFRASPTGATAYGKPGEASYFTQALIQSLDIFASQLSSDSNEKWLVELSEINRALKKTVKRLSHGKQKRTDYQDISETYIFHELREPPLLPINVSIHPSSVTEQAQIKLNNSHQNYYLPPWNFNVQASRQYYKININSPSDYVIDSPQDHNLDASDPMKAPITCQLTVKRR
ncbi:MAG: caspase family protein [Crocosphaera sp.]|nr:caspase family protein [Crocosphaera sp.]